MVYYKVVIKTIHETIAVGNHILDMALGPRYYPAYLYLTSHTRLR